MFAVEALVDDSVRQSGVGVEVTTVMPWHRCFNVGTTRRSVADTSRSSRPCDRRWMAGSCEAAVAAEPLVWFRSRERLERCESAPVFTL